MKLSLTKELTIVLRSRVISPGNLCEKLLQSLDKYSKNEFHICVDLQNSDEGPFFRRIIIEIPFKRSSIIKNLMIYSHIMIIIDELRPPGFEKSSGKLNLPTARISKSSIVTEPFHLGVLLTKVLSGNQSSYSTFLD
jgi:hypothetical protein